MTRRRGLYLARVRGTKVWPKDPVPPVIRIEEFVSIRKESAEWKESTEF